MGKPAARIGDMHVCPKVNPGPVPHVGGPVAIGQPNVLIGNMPAAREGDMCVCVGPPDKIAKGSSSVLIGGKPAARMGDPTSHGGRVVIGCPTVLIGDSAGGGGGGGAAGAVAPPPPMQPGQKYGPLTLPDGGKASTECEVFKDPKTVHKDKEEWRKPVVKDGVAQPLKGTQGKPKTIPKYDERGQVLAREYKGKTYLVKKDDNGFPEFTIAETYIDDSHIDSQDDKAHFEDANKRMKEILIDDPKAAEKMGLSDKHVKFFMSKKPKKESPPGLTWHHHQDVGKMQLIDLETHKRVNHVGGMEIWGGGRPQ